ncbi:Wall-associated receptor kinase 1 [Prunus dulcis]|uniref:Wall-associated receptor kinase 1 n=1 Tax=Prunus dulcis TaxID=3755 RepID=A0A4Y1RWP6_PRUDU|nr:Wall-associated receptor kinase 1 [Prunus dulcis]
MLCHRNVTDDTGFVGKQEGDPIRGSDDLEKLELWTVAFASPFPRKSGFSQSSFSCLISLSIAVTSFIVGLSSGQVLTQSRATPST